MKVAAYQNDGTLTIQETEKPSLNGQFGAIAKVLYCGICGSDIVKIAQKLVPEGTVLGHEVVCQIEEIKTSDNISLSPGEIVSVAHHVPCYSCNYCTQDSHSMCRSFKKSNFIPGGFAEYIFIQEEHLKNTVIPVPEGLDLKDATFMEPIGCVLRALDRADIKEGQNVLVVGLGMIGLLFLQALKPKNVKLLACDILDTRLELAKQLGADFVFNSTKSTEMDELIRDEILFDGVDVVILAAGAAATVSLALNTVRDGGKIVVFSSVPDSNTAFSNNEIYYRELSVIGAYSSSPEFLAPSMEMLIKKTIKVDSLYQVMPLDAVNQAVDKTVRNEVMKVVLEV